MDTNYYWMHHVRVHIPAVTYPEVKFLCLDQEVHMAAGECWIFDSWKKHNVINPVECAAHSSRRGYGRQRGLLGSRARAGR